MLQCYENKCTDIVPQRTIMYENVITYEELERSCVYMVVFCRRVSTQRYYCGDICTPTQRQLIYDCTPT